MTDELQSLRTELNELQQLIDEYKSRAQEASLGTRM